MSPHPVSAGDRQDAAQFKHDLLARLGLQTDATRQDVQAAHNVLVEFLEFGSDMSGMAGMGDQSGGMMPAQEINNLGNATGSAFDRMWLKMMVRHHRGAVDMATTALAQGGTLTPGSSPRRSSTASPRRSRR